MLKNLPFVCSPEPVKTPSFDRLMKRMNVVEESNQKLVHQIGKKQLVYQLMCKFQILPVMHYLSTRRTILLLLVRQTCLKKSEETIGWAYRQEDKYSPLIASFINMAHQVFKKIIINDIFIQSFLYDNFDFHIIGSP